MARVKRGVTARRKHKKVLKQAKGYYGNRSKNWRTANQAVYKAGPLPAEHRRRRSRYFRSLCVTRITAASRMNGLSYSRFIHGLKLAWVERDRKVVAYLAMNDQAAFAALVDKARSSSEQ